MQSYAVNNLLGQELINDNGISSFSINLEGLSRGTYLVRLVGIDGSVVTEKVVRQ